MVKGMWQWEELKHTVLGVIVPCNKFQGDLHCKESKQIFHNLSKKCCRSDRLGYMLSHNGRMHVNFCHTTCQGLKNEKTLVDCEWF